MAFISVIVPVYKVEAYLRRCVDSILAQTHRDFELILVDDGSPDNCPAICDEYAAKDERVHVIHQENGGLSAARNAGIEWSLRNSKSEWIAFVDSDDYVLHNYLEYLTMGTSEGAEVACVQLFRKHPEEILLTAQLEPWNLVTPETYWESGSSRNSSCAKIYHKKLFSDIRYPIGKLHEDEYVTYLLLFSQQKIAFSTSQLYVYCEREDSITTSAWHERRLDSFGGIVGQCLYFHEHGFEAAFTSSIGWLNGICKTALEHWVNISENRRKMVQAEVRRIQVKWIHDPHQYPSFMRLRNPYLSWGGCKWRHFRDFIARRGILGGIRYLLSRKS